jgi:hypothetical protein
MIRYAMASAALLAALGSAVFGSGPARAQAVVEDPGYCAQYYPTANCNNYGPGNPLYPGSYRPSGSYDGSYRGPYAAAAPVVVQRHRRQHHRH